MTTDVFVAGLIGMAIIALTIFILCYAQDAHRNRESEKRNKSSLPKTKK